MFENGRVGIWCITDKRSDVILYLMEDYDTAQNAVDFMNSRVVEPCYSTEYRYIQRFIPDALVTLDTLRECAIEELELGVRSYNILKRQGIDTFEELINIPDSVLINLPNLGVKSYREIKERIAEWMEYIGKPLQSFKY